MTVWMRIANVVSTRKLQEILDLIEQHNILNSCYGCITCACYCFLVSGFSRFNDTQKMQAFNMSLRQLLMKNELDNSSVPFLEIVLPLSSSKQAWEILHAVCDSMASMCSHNNANTDLPKLLYLSASKLDIESARGFLKKLNSIHLLSFATKFSLQLHIFSYFPQLISEVNIGTRLQTLIKQTVLFLVPVIPVQNFSKTEKMKNSTEIINEKLLFIAKNKCHDSHIHFMLEKPLHDFIYNVQDINVMTSSNFFSSCSENIFLHYLRSIHARALRYILYCFIEEEFSNKEALPKQDVLCDDGALFLRYFERYMQSVMKKKAAECCAFNSNP